MIEVRMEFHTPLEMLEFFGSLPANIGGNPGTLVGVAGESVDKPAKKAAKKAAKNDEPQTSGAGASAADPVAGMLAAQAPVMQAPVTPPPPPNPPTQQSAPVEQKDLIATFTALGKAKGRDAFAPILSQFSATAVIGPAGVGIPPEQWGAAIAACNKALAA